MVRFLSKTRNCPRISSNMRPFSHIIEDLNLRDLTVDGGPFTWCSGQNFQSSLRLDHFLVLDD